MLGERSPRIPVVRPPRTSLLVEPSRQRLCPDCPAVHEGGPHSLVSPLRGCSLHWVAVAARQPLPSRWPTAYAIALVRRGVVIRQRLDRNGRGVAIDAVGVGAGFVVERGARESTASGYAATDSLVCLYPRALVETQPADAGEAADLFAIARSSIQRAERIADARGRGTAMEKVAALLSALADELGARPRELVPSALTQRDLAALLAMRHESVCRVLRKLERDGTIRRDEDGIHLVDRERLCASVPSDSR